MGLWNRERTEDLGGSGSGERKWKPDGRPESGDKGQEESGVGTDWAERLQALWKMGLSRSRKLPEYITENVSEELIQLEDLVKVYDTGA